MRGSIAIMCLLLPVCAVAQHVEISANGGTIWMVPKKKNDIKIRNGSLGYCYAAQVGITFRHTTQAGVGLEDHLEKISYTTGTNYSTPVLIPYAYINWRFAGVKNNFYIGVRLGENIPQSSNYLGAAGQTAKPTLMFSAALGYTYYFARHLGANIEADPGGYLIGGIPIKAGLRVVF